MSNLTAAQSRSLWSTAQAFTILNIFFELYILIALILSGIRTKKLCTPWNRTETRILLIGISTPLMHLVNIALTESLLAANLTVGPGYNTTAANYLCDVIIRVKHVSYSLALLPSFVSLWYRQRTLYRSMCLSNGKKLKGKVSSNVSIALVLTGAVVIPTYNIVRSCHIRTENGCVTHPRCGEGLRIKIVNSCLVSFTWVLMVSLLVYLLATSRTTESNTNRFIRKVTVKAFYSLVICIASEVVCIIVATLAFPANWPRYPTCVLYDLSLLANSVSIVVSYVNPGNIFFGFMPKFTKKETTS